MDFCFCFNNNNNEGQLNHVTDALQIFKGHLTSWEKEEILKYSQIWYVGQEVQSSKKINGDPANPLVNFGFDDENGNYHKVTAVSM